MRIEFRLNGVMVTVDTEPGRPLLRLLKEDFGIVSVKEGCGRGECGTCTVLLDGRPVTSCMVATLQVAGREVVTLEGLEADDTAERIKEAFIESGAVQCGFCTPGFIISAYSLLRENVSPNREEVRQALAGNLCRCTGYTKIVDAVMLAAAKKNDG